MHFFLHGGATSPDSESNKKYFQTLCSYGNKILIFPFGEWTERETLLFEKYMRNFTKNVTEKELSFACASRDIPTLVEQIRHADILFFSGWVPARHLEVTNQIPNLKQLIQDKILTGPSAWAAMRTRAYYSARNEDIREWNNFLHIKLMVHRWADRHPWLSNEERLHLLENYGENLPVYKIPEWEYIEFTL